MNLKRVFLLIVAVLLLTTLLVGVSLNTKRTSVIASSGPMVTAVVRDNWGISGMPPANLRYEYTRHPHYTLVVNGAGFTGGAQVQLALINTASLRVAARGSTAAGPSGLFTYRMSGFDPGKGVLHVWFNSTRALDIFNVTRA